MAYEVDQVVLTQLATIGLDFVTAGGLSPKLAQELALREFQVCAALPVVAQIDSTAVPTLHYISRLKPVANTKVYAGVPHGHPDDATKEILALWVKTENQFRVPIVGSALFAERAAGSQNWTQIKGDSLEVARFADGNRISENLVWYNTPRMLSMKIAKPPKRAVTVHCYPERRKPPVRFFVRDFSGFTTPLRLLPFRAQPPVACWSRHMTGRKRTPSTEPLVCRVRKLSSLLRRRL